MRALGAPAARAGLWQQWVSLPCRHPGKGGDLSKQKSELRKELGRMPAFAGMTLREGIGSQYFVILERASSARCVRGSSIRIVEDAISF